MGTQAEMPFQVHELSQLLQSEIDELEGAFWHVLA